MELVFAQYFIVTLLFTFPNTIFCGHSRFDHEDPSLLLYANSVSSQFCYLVAKGQCLQAKESGKNKKPMLAKHNTHRWHYRTPEICIATVSIRISFSSFRTSKKLPNGFSANNLSGEKRELANRNSMNNLVDFL